MSINAHLHVLQNDCLKPLTLSAVGNENGSIAFIGLLLLINAHLLQSDCLKPLTLSAVGNNDRMLQNKFVVVANVRGAGTLLTVKCSSPGTYHETNAQGLPRGGCSWLGLTCT